MSEQNTNQNWRNYELNQRIKKIFNLMRHLMSKFQYSYYIFQFKPGKIYIKREYLALLCLIYIVIRVTTNENNNADQTLEKQQTLMKFK